MLKKIKLFLAQTLNFFLLSFAYFLGVGLTVVFSKLRNNKFLDFDFSSSRKGSFSIFSSKKSSLEKMF